VLDVFWQAARQSNKSNQNSASEASFAHGRAQIITFQVGKLLKQYMHQALFYVSLKCFVRSTTMLDLGVFRPLVNEMIGHISG
jgi:hypothetical protein